MSYKVQGNTVIYDDRVVQVAAGTTAERPGSPQTGMIRYNTDSNVYEGYTGTSWNEISNLTDIQLFSSDPSPNSWVQLDGSTLLQSNYPGLFAKYGLLRDGIRSNILVYTNADGYALTDIIYVGNTYVFSSAATIFKTTDFVSVTRSEVGLNFSGDIRTLYAANLYVSAHTLDEISTSTDAIAWTARTSGTTTTIRTLAYGNLLYLYGGDGGRIGTSTDAITWTARTSGTTTPITSIVYGNNLYVYSTTKPATGNAGIFTSTDAITWTARTSNVVTDINSLAFGNDLYLYGGDGGRIGTSTDGITWTARTSGTTQAIEIVSFGNNLYLFGTAQGNISTSTDAITWTARTSGTTTFLIDIKYANNQYVYGGSGGVLGTSTDGITWTVRTSGTTSSIFSVLYGNATYLYSGTSVVAKSTDAITWSPTVYKNIATLYYANSLYLYGGDGGVLGTSTDAITWTDRTSGVTTAINGLTFGNGTYVYGGYGGVLGTSTDGITWTVRTSGVTSTINDMTYGNGLYLIVGSGSSNLTNPGFVRKSTDAITWESAHTVTVTNVNSIIYFNDLYVYGGDRVYTSTDAITWTQRSATSGTLSARALQYYASPNLYISLGTSSGGSTNFVSTDGIKWNPSGTHLSGTHLMDSNNDAATDDDGFVYTSSRFIYSKPLYSYDKNTEFVVPETFEAPYISARPENMAIANVYVKAS